MTAPFRDQHHKCPTCNEELREFRGRWACDACGGVMMKLEDLSAGIYDMTSVEPVLTFVGDAPSKRACPICDGPMTECKVRIQLEDEHVKPRSADPKLDRCAAHGLWFDDQELGEVLTAVSGKGHGSASPVIMKGSSKAEPGPPRMFWFKINGRGFF